MSVVLPLWVPILVTSTVRELPTPLKVLQFNSAQDPVLKGEQQTSQTGCRHAGESTCSVLSVLNSIHVSVIFCLQWFKSRLKWNIIVLSQPTRALGGWKHWVTGRGSNTAGVCHGSLEGFCQSCGHGPTALLHPPLTSMMRKPGRTTVWGKGGLNTTNDTVVFALAPLVMVRLAFCPNIFCIHN